MCVLSYYYCHRVLYVSNTKHLTTANLAMRGRELGMAADCNVTEPGFESRRGKV